MNERIYTFQLKCPRCGRDGTTFTTMLDPPPVVNCGHCLMEDTEIVEYKVVRVSARTVDHSYNREPK